MRCCFLFQNFAKCLITAISKAGKKKKKKIMFRTVHNEKVFQGLIYVTVHQGTYLHVAP